MKTLQDLRPGKRLLILVIFTLVVLMLSSCCCPTPTPTPTPTPPIPTPSIASEELIVNELYKCPDPWRWALSRGGPPLIQETFWFERPNPDKYLKNFIMLTGNVAALEAIREQFSDELHFIDSTDFSYLAGFLPGHILSNRYSGYAVYLFELELGQVDPAKLSLLFKHLTVSNQLPGITAYGTPSNPIFVDVVYLQGNPWVGEGSPWVGEGSPWVGEGSSLDSGVSGAQPTPAPVELLSPVEANEAFWTQWALAEDHGVRYLPSASNPPSSQVLKLRIGVFDSSPFSEEGLWEVIRGPRVFHLCVSLPNPSFDIGMQLGDEPHVRLENFQEHGFFVSGLANAIQPDAELHLVRVLNDQGVGDLFTLTKSINDFLRTSLAENSQLALETGQALSLEGTVLNLSLGFEPAAAFPDERDDHNQASTLWEALANSTKSASVESLTSFAALRILSDITEGLGGVIVAAAGNNSDGLAVPEPAQIPASFSNVIGVGGLNIDGGRSCYSNQAEFYAPAGDGIQHFRMEPIEGGIPLITLTPGIEPISPLPPPLHPEPTIMRMPLLINACIPRQNECPQIEGDCPYGIISTVRTDVSPNGYAYWVGTSFSTPLVSGLSASLLQNSGYDENYARTRIRLWAQLDGRVETSPP